MKLAVQRPEAHRESRGNRDGEEKNEASNYVARSGIGSARCDHDAHNASSCLRGSRGYGRELTAKGKERQN